MKKGLKSVSILLIGAAMLLGACSQKTCPGVGSSGKDGPKGNGGKAQQKLFNKDMR